MARFQNSSARRFSTFSRRLYGLSILSFFLITSMVMLSAVGQNQEPRTLARRAVAQPNPRCNEFTQSWGEWCVYTFTDNEPDVLFPALSSARGVATWYRDGQWRAVVLGTRDAESALTERLYAMQSSDAYGLSNWQLMAGEGESQALVDDALLETDTLGDPFQRVLGVSDPQVNEEQKSGLGLPSIVPFEELVAPDSAQEVGCCDTLLFGSGEDGLRSVTLRPGEEMRVQEEVQIPDGALPGTQNRVLSVADYRAAGIEDVLSISSPRVMRGSAEDAHTLIYEELDASGQSALSIARSNWPTQPYQIVTRDLMPGVPARDPYLIKSQRGVYYLFFVRSDQPGQVWVARSAKLAGPYGNQRAVLSVPELLDGAEVTAPTVFCNQAIDQWQIYFALQRPNSENTHLYAGLLARSCDQEPVLVQ